jgi:hypothetical protein
LGIRVPEASLEIKAIQDHLDLKEQEDLAETGENKASLAHRYD